MASTVQNGFYGASGAVYFVTTGGTYTTFSKEEVNGTLVWAKSYNGFSTFTKGNVMLSDESKFYSFSLSTTSVAVYEISGTDGSLVGRYEQ